MSHRPHLNIVRWLRRLLRSGDSERIFTDPQAHAIWEQRDVPVEERLRRIRALLDGKRPG